MQPLLSVISAGNKENHPSCTVGTLRDVGMPRRVLVGTPAHSGTVQVWYANSLTNTVRLCMQRGIDLREVYLSYDAIVQNARNDLIKIALENNFDDLIFIDADQEWIPEWVTRLLSYPVDCVGGTVRKKTDVRESYNVKHSSLNIPADPKTGLLIVDALGTGFLRLSRHAMQLLWDNSEPYMCMGKDPTRWIFDIRPINGVLVGEDVMLGTKLRALGIETYLDPSMTCAHIGMKKYVGNFADWLERAQAEERASSAA